MRQRAALALELGAQQLGVHRADQLAQRPAPGADDLGGALGADLAGQAVEQRADLLLDERRERVLVAQRVEHREAERLVVAALAEARDRLDHPHVVGVVAAPVGREDAELGEPVEHVRAGRRSARGRRCARAARVARVERELEDRVALLDERRGLLGPAVHHLADPRAAA